MSDEQMSLSAIDQSKPKLEWHDYFMGSLKAPLSDGAHFMINITGSGLQARFSDGARWIWIENFSDTEDAKEACQRYMETKKTEG